MNFALIADIPNFFCKHRNILLMYDCSCITCFFSILVMKLQVSLSSWRENSFSHHFLFGFDSLAPVSCWLLENSLVDSLEDVRFLNLSRGAPVAWLLFFSSIGILQIRNFVKRFPHSFAHPHATPDMALLSPLESSFEQEYIEKLIILNKQRR